MVKSSSCYGQNIQSVRIIFRRNGNKKKIKSLQDQEKGPLMN